MRRLTALLAILGVLSLNALALAASVTCPLVAVSAVEQGCCCGEAGTCADPPGEAGLTGACCEVTGDGQPSESPAPATAPPVPLQFQAAPVQTGEAVPRSVAQGPLPVAPRLDAGRPPPYRLFCSLLI